MVLGSDLTTSMSLLTLGSTLIPVHLVLLPSVETFLPLLLLLGGEIRYWRIWYLVPIGLLLENQKLMAKVAHPKTQCSVPFPLITLPCFLPIPQCTICPSLVIHKGNTDPGLVQRRICPLGVTNHMIVKGMVAVAIIGEIPCPTCGTSQPNLMLS